MLQVTLTSTDPPSGVSGSERESQLDSQGGKVMFFFYFMYLLLMKFAFKISPVVLFGLTDVYKGCLGYLSIAGLHFLIQVNS